MKQTCKAPQKIALMDSHSLTLLGLSSLIKSIDNSCDISIQESSLGGIINALMYQTVDILITDLQSTEEGVHEGLDTLLHMNAQYPDLHIVVYTSCHDGNILRRLLDHVNISMIARSETLADTRELFSQALEKKRVFSKKICCDVARISETHHYLISKLTRSEIDVLKHLLNGMDLQQIAQIKKLSIKTISAHKCNAMRKLNARTDAELFLQVKNIFE